MRELDLTEVTSVQGGASESGGGVALTFGILFGAVFVAVLLGTLAAKASDYERTQ